MKLLDVIEFMKKEQEKGLLIREEHEKEILSTGLPKGGRIHIRKQNSRSYASYAYWCTENKKNLFNYIGDVTKNELVIDEIERIIERREYLENEIKILDENLKILGKSINEMLKLEEKRKKHDMDSSVRQKVKEVSADNKQEPSAQAKSIKNKETP